MYLRTNQLGATIAPKTIFRQPTATISEPFVLSPTELVKKQAEAEILTGSDVIYQRNTLKSTPAIKAASISRRFVRSDASGVVATRPVVRPNVLLHTTAAVLPQMANQELAPNIITKPPLFTEIAATTGGLTGAAILGIGLLLFFGSYKKSFGKPKRRRRRRARAR